MGKHDPSLPIRCASLLQMKTLAQLAAEWTVEVPPRPPSPPAEHLLGETPDQKVVQQLCCLVSWDLSVALRLPCTAAEDLLQHLDMSSPDSDLPHVESRLDDLLADFCSNDDVSSDDDSSIHLTQHVACV